MYYQMIPVETSNHLRGRGRLGGTIDFEVLRHRSEESGLTQQLHIRGVKVNIV